MGKKINREVNAGVQANVGMNFQKNCTIYLFLEKIHQLDGQKYFIILEHHEDIVFGYLDENSELTKVETFQAKKSTNPWKISELYSIIKKISETCQGILDDNYPKANTFIQENYFATNNTVDLSCTVKSNSYREIINESRADAKYLELDNNIRSKIESGNINIRFSQTDINNLANFYIKFIDLSRTSKSQHDQLIGKFQSEFGDRIIDHKSALETFLFYLDEIDSIYNQGNVARLADLSKRIESDKINELLNVLTTKKKAFDLWRKKADEISISMSIPAFEQSSFRLYFENSFDKFKDLNEIEHRKIFNYVLKSKANFDQCYTDQDCLRYLSENFAHSNNTQLTTIQLNAAIYAAFIEIKESGI